MAQWHAGAAVLLLSTLAFAYYATWLLLLPFLDPDLPVHAYFPDPVFAFLAAAAVLCAVVLLAGAVAGAAMLTHGETAGELAAHTRWEFQPPPPLSEEGYIISGGSGGSSDSKPKGE